MTNHMDPQKEIIELKQQNREWQEVSANRLRIMSDMEKQNDALEQQNADLVAALEKIANPPTSPPSDKADRSVDIAQQALAQAKEE